jgi:hypothetical protein
VKVSELSPRSKLDWIVREHQRLTEKQKLERAMRLHLEMKRRQETPGVGHYEVERSLMRLDQQVPVYSIGHQKKVLFNEEEARGKVHLPDIN